MTLQTWEEEELLHRIRRLEHQVERLILLCQEILIDVQHPPERFRPTARIVVAPD